MRSCLQIPAASFFVCFLAFTANAAAQAVYLFSFESGTGDWGNPAGIEVDGQSNIYVTDYGASEGADAVEVFDTLCDNVRRASPSSWSSVMPMLLEPSRSNRANTLLSSLMRSSST